MMHWRTVHGTVRFVGPAVPIGALAHFVPQLRAAFFGLLCPGHNLFASQKTPSVPGSEVRIFYTKKTEALRPPSMMSLRQ